MRQFFEQERREHRPINLNNVLEEKAAATGVNRNLIAKIQTTEDVLNWKKKPGVPVPTASDPKIPTKFSSIIRQVVPTLDFILERLNQKKVKDLDHLNFFTGGKIPHPESRIWI